MPTKFEIEIHPLCGECNNPLETAARNYDHLLDEMRVYFSPCKHCLAMERIKGKTEGVEQLGEAVVKGLQR